MLIFKRVKSAIRFLLFLSIGIASLCLAKSPSDYSWQIFIAQLKKDATSQGIDSEYFDQLFAHMLPDNKVLRLDKQQAPKSHLNPLKPPAYQFVISIDSARIQAGIKQYAKHKDLLQNIAQRYGVDPIMLLAVWGKESHYGQYQGRFPILQSLATLAFDSRRGTFFRTELLQALHILNDQHVTEHGFKGSWAGASGHPQFMPTSWQYYAIDHDQDGKRDIWLNTGDAIASIANYLAKNGWKTGQIWWIPVRLAKPIKSDNFGLKVTKTLAEWQALGVETKASIPANSLGSLLKGKDNSTYLVLANFRVIMRYNQSVSYAASVAYLADRIRQGH